MEIYVRATQRNCHPRHFYDEVAIFKTEDRLPKVYKNIHPDMIEATSEHFIIYEQSPVGQCDPITRGKILFKCNMSIVDYYERKTEC